MMNVYPSKETVEALVRGLPVGTRVKLNHMDDPYAPAPGTLGTVQGVDDAGTIWVKWDNGSGLGVAWGVDSVSIFCCYHNH